MTTDFLEKHDFHFFLEDSWSKFKLDLWAKAGIEDMMCSDLGNLREHETIYMVNSVQDVHLLNANPYCEDMLEVFRGLNLFSSVILFGRGIRSCLLQCRSHRHPSPSRGTGKEG